MIRDHRNYTSDFNRENRRKLGCQECRNYRRKEIDTVKGKRILEQCRLQAVSLAFDGDYVACSGKEWIEPAGDPDRMEVCE